jgi:hypothetical protein
MTTNTFSGTKAGLLAKVALFSLSWACWISGFASEAQTPPPTAPPQSVMISEVVKLVQAHQSDEVVVTYIRSKGAAYNLSADEILYLSNQGASQNVISALQAPAAGGPPPGPAPSSPAEAVAPAPVAAAPAPTLAQFRTELAPAGAWVEVPGYGPCWRPAVAAGNPEWRPYCDQGHWVYTENGWFWQSDYPWGGIVFHYGRWHIQPGYGWVWVPGYNWGPAWVCWRRAESCYGWAPLPPAAEFRVGVGLFYNGHLGVNVDFGLTVGCFTFVGYNHFWEHDYHRYMLPREQVNVIYRNTTIVNNYTVVNNHFVNEGLHHDQLATLTHREVKVEKGFVPPPHLAAPAGVSHFAAPATRSPGTSRQGITTSTTPGSSHIAPSTRTVPGAFRSTTTTGATPSASHLPPTGTTTDRFHVGPSPGTSPATSHPSPATGALPGTHVTTTGGLPPGTTRVTPSTGTALDRFHTGAGAGSPAARTMPSKTQTLPQGKPDKTKEVSK